MLSSRDLVDLDLGLPQDREAVFRHHAVVVSAQRILGAEPTVVYVVPLTSTLRAFHSEVTIEPDEHNGLATSSAAQCQHLRAVSTERVASGPGNVGAATLARIRETIAVMLDVPISSRQVVARTSTQFAGSASVSMHRRHKLNNLVKAPFHR
jgi:mRNA interferase MazF